MDAGEYRERLRLELAGLGGGAWGGGTLDQALRQALEDYNDVNPDQAIATHTFASASREAALSASTFARLIRVLRVWLAYTARDPGAPPQGGAVARVWFARAQTVEGLDAAASTTLPGEHSQMLVTGSSGYAASARASALRETV